MRQHPQMKFQNLPYWNFLKGGGNFADFLISKMEKIYWTEGLHSKKDYIPLTVSSILCSNHRNYRIKIIQTKSKPSYFWKTVSDFFYLHMYNTLGRQKNTNWCFTLKFYLQDFQQSSRYSRQQRVKNESFQSFNFYLLHSGNGKSSKKLRDGFIV